MSQFPQDQGATTKAYPQRYVEEEPTQVLRKLAISLLVAAVSRQRFVAPRRSASGTASLSRLALEQTRSQRGLRIFMR